MYMYTYMYVQGGYNYTENCMIILLFTAASLFIKKFPATCTCIQYQVLSLSSMYQYVGQMYMLHVRVAGINTEMSIAGFNYWKWGLGHSSTV